MPGALGLRRLRRWTLNAVAVFGFVYLSIPLIFVTWLSFYQQAIPNYPPEGYSVRWYSAAIEDERFIDAFVTSLKVGVLATLIGLLVALPAALAIPESMRALVRRRAGRSRAADSAPAGRRTRSRGVQEVSTCVQGRARRAARARPRGAPSSPTSSRRATEAKVARLDAGATAARTRAAQ